MLSKTPIPYDRLFLYLFILSLALPCLIYFQSSQRLRALASIENAVDDAYLQAYSKETKQALNKVVLQHFRDADHFYIEKQIERVVLLERETENLNQVVNYEGFVGDDAIRKRLEAIGGEANSISFSEGTVQTYPQFQETVESLVQPVEMNILDVRKILTLVEGRPIWEWKNGPKRPQLIITDFKIERKKAFENNEIYLVNLKFLKREFL